MKKENPGKQKSDAAKREKLKILVSSVVYGYEDMLESIYALLEEFGYHRLFATAQFRRYGDLEMKYLSRLRDVDAMTHFVRKEQQ